MLVLRYKVIGNVREEFEDIVTKPVNRPTGGAVKRIDGYLYTRSR